MHTNAGILTLLLALAGLAACQQQHEEQCYCPAGGPSSATIGASCAQGATVQATGVCTASLVGGQIVFVASDGGTGDCHVVVTWGDGTTASEDFQFATEWLACGSDPHGCGQATYATPTKAQLAGPCADGGADA